MTFIKPWCDDCEWRENPEVMRRMWEVRAKDPMHGFMLGVRLGGMPSQYERHREAWEKTGDVDELQRMTHHVTWEHA